MVSSSLDLTSEKISAYRKAAQRRQDLERLEITPLRNRAWEAAHQAAQVLRERFNATRVVVFGSLLHEQCFTRWSDVDIAAWGIAPEDTFRAIGALMDLESPVQINLVDINACRPSLLRVIEQEGVDL